MKEKIAYIGHPYHKKTKSTQFLIDYLKEFYDVDVFWDESWQSNKITDYSHLDDKYKAVILFYIMTNEDSLKTLNHKNIIFIPMFEAIKKWKFKDWYRYKNTKILNFCMATHKELEIGGFNTTYIKYFPPVGEFTPGNPKEVFFWQRQTKVNINTLKRIFKDNDVKIHVHNAIDPGKRIIPPTAKDEEKYSITYSSWFDSKEDMKEFIKGKGVYIAPRLEEGIGMSFLEAMSMGKAVIAHKQHTMDEYIVDGVTGYLCNFRLPKQLNLEDIEQVQKNTYEYMKTGHENWLEDRKKIIELINQESIKTEFGLCKTLFKCYLSVSIGDFIKFKIGKSGYLKLFGVDIIERKNGQ